MAVAYARLKRYLGLTRGTVRVYDVMQQLTEPGKEILELFHVDVIDLKRSLELCGVSWAVTLDYDILYHSISFCFIYVLSGSLLVLFPPALFLLGLDAAYRCTSIPHF